MTSKCEEEEEEAKQSKECEKNKTMTELNQNTNKKLNCMQPSTPADSKN